ncbi:electron transfer flavoprotein subunit beta [Halomonas sp. McH1-25]|uniref:electron transfer flavoprotein subunit beta n=1 Tax=unclassified Halomonas TaxID=2609666 RepID=UPI001EF43681|nr:MULTISPECIES: electron transfer flavoprotein subunit beta [unclassified Halomonas]MCG7599754.1 electron transfer flavoprotein subunit beta [Halomonas sp. McH1-25]MCP1341650.1 electron transfer flavoprotein subunit beta [Halomonas sp. FL8]MCP1359808.1 electron transfer flavoprotein subunit beta [Halomonas sp. BBD45]MCP1365346.1 electron transfer flavoprotein subunit beta [Halomonas sp. BBD48]
MPHNAKSSDNAGLNVAVLVSVGRHPLTARARRADQDARAVEMALTLSGAAVRLVHASVDDSDNEAALRSYLGMGIGEVNLIKQASGADVVPALVTSLRDMAPQLVLTGTRAETGEGSGLVPYLLSEALGWPVISGLAAVESIEQGVATVLQALPRGKRRRLRVRLPAIATVDSSAPAARQSAFGPARRGEFDTYACASVMDELQAKWQVQPARKRPKRLKIVKSSSARDRFKAAAAKAESGGGQLLSDVSPEQGAEAIFALLKEEGVLR